MRLSFVLSLALAIAAIGPAKAEDDVAGAYLAGRQAAISFDYDAASSYFTRALIGDPDNPDILESALASRLALGELDRAQPLARRMDQQGLKSQATNMTVIGGLARSGNYEAILAELSGGRSLGRLVDELVKAWSELGMGRMSEATAAFDAIAAEDGVAAFGLYHKALALASVGDFEGADRILSGEAAGPLRGTRRSLAAHVQILSQLERNADALTLIAESFGADLDPTFRAMRDALVAGETLPFTLIRNPQDGLAEVFLTIAGAMNANAPDAYALAYARLAEAVRPDFTDAILLSGQILEAQRQFELANQTYNRIPREDPAFHLAEIGRADVLMRDGRPDAAIEVLQQLAKSHGSEAVVWTALGDALRTEERFAEAADAYDAAIGLFPGDDPGQWGVYYARGIAHERARDWPAAEADFRKALALNPDQPDVLNYLGYSFVEMKTNYDEALDMIERAVAAEPEAGHIVDSLGWALYRLGRYGEAVGHMERAVELMPEDPVVNDHLGDVYWAVGRKREAEFQWKRALSFVDPKDEGDIDPDRIRRKLEVGLDTVLEEEGAAPLAVTENAD